MTNKGVNLSVTVLLCAAVATLWLLIRRNVPDVYAIHKTATSKEQATVGIQAETHSPPPAQAVANQAAVHTGKLEPRAEAKTLPAVLETDAGRKLITAIEMSDVERVYGHLLNEMRQRFGVTQDALSQFKQLLLQKRTGVLDAATIAYQNGIEAERNRFVFSAAVFGAAAGFEQPMRDLVGREAYEYHVVYVQQIPERNLLHEMALLLPDTDTLSQAQSEQLRNLLFANQPVDRVGLGMTAEVDGVQMRLGALYGTSQSIVTDTTVRGASDFLTPAQLQALRLLQERQVLEGKMREYYRKAGRAK